MALVPNSPRRKMLALVLLSAWAVVFDSHAQEVENQEHSTIEPSIYAEFRHDDNVLRSATDELSSLVTILSPRILAIIKPPRHRIVLGYEGEFASYAKSSADNYDDHKFEAAAFLELGRRGLFDLSAIYEDGHENRGAGLSEGLEPGSGQFLSEPDEYSQTQIGGRFTYGVTGTSARLVLEAGTRGLEYDNNRDRTRFFDYDNAYGGATFYFRVMPSTSLVFGVETNDFDYREDRTLQPSLNSRERNFLFGATWAVTGKSTGTVRYGYVRKEYDDSARPVFTGVNWAVDVRWSLRSYSHLDFATSRYPSEITSITGDVIENTRHSVAWSHQWTPRVATRLSTMETRQAFRGSAEARVETLELHDLTLVYDMRRWLTWELGVSISSRDSNIDRFNSDVNVMRLGVNVTF